MDEAQLVEGSSAAAEMCLKLSAEIRWCVTGTPMSKSVNGLFTTMIAYKREMVYGNKIDKTIFRSIRIVLVCRH